MGTSTRCKITLHASPGQDNSLFQEPPHSKRQGKGADSCQNEHLL